MTDCSWQASVMRSTHSPFHRLRSPAAAGPWLIAIGLAVLIAATWIPVLPVLTPMAVVALGATYATESRQRASVAAVPLLMLHAATYATLYVLFVGARFQSTARSATTGISLLDGLDLGASWMFLALAAHCVAAALRRA